MRTEVGTRALRSPGMSIAADEETPSKLGREKEGSGSPLRPLKSAQRLGVVACASNPPEAEAGVQEIEGQQGLPSETLAQEASHKSCSGEL